MLLTHLHRTRDYTPFVRQGEIGTLPATVGGILRMVIASRPWQWLGILFFVSIANSLQLAVPYVTKLIIDKMASAPDGLDDRMAYVMPTFYLLIMLVLARFVAQQSMWIASYFWRPARRRMSQAVSAYVLGHTPHFFESDLSGRIIQKMTSLYSSIEGIFSAIMWNWTPTAAFFIVALVMLAQVNLLLAGIAVIWFLILFVGSRFIGRDIGPNAIVVNEAKSQMVGRMADGIVNIRNVLQFARYGHEVAGLAARENAIVDVEQYWYLSILNVRLFNQIMSLSALVGIIGVSIWLWAKGQATVGDIALASTLTTMVVGRAIELAENVPETLDQIGTARDSLNTLVKPRTLVDAPNAPALQVPHGAITLTDVSFAYPGGANVYSHFDLAIKAGERVGVVGVSGSGKSTLIAMILRMYDVQDGTIAIDGQNIARVTQESLRRSVSFIPQDTLLFHRSIRENIAYGKLDATDAEIHFAAQQAQAHEFIEKLPHGYDTMVGERGVKLSGGQRQRVAIARALLKNAPILILDEATSALDSEAESEIQTAIKIAMGGKTVIAIAHRLSTIASLDRLIVLADGKIVEQGSHAQLIAAGGTYAALWHHQSGGFLGVE